MQAESEKKTSVKGLFSEFMFSECHASPEGFTLFIYSYHQSVSLFIDAAKRIKHETLHGNVRKSFRKNKKNDAKKCVSNKLL